VGYSYRNNGQIKSFWPDDTENTIYKSNEPSVFELLEDIKEKWPDADLNDVIISSEYIHTDCLTYDRYDPLDYTEFVVVTYKPWNGEK
jgi:hypothetical protein